ncbi:MAG: PhoH family protein, partial [Verrucomicrobiae bacterium]|nr:PhoH family protein [Verrucomicrobiae bacterium]
RLGNESSCVVTGDPSQIDLRPAHKSGLLEAMRLLRNVEGIHFTEFGRRDVVRHPVVQRIIEAYETGRDEEEERRKSEGGPRRRNNGRERGDLENAN